MKYCDLKTLSIKADHSPKYRLCQRANASKKTGKFIGIYTGMTTSLPDAFSFALISPETIDDLFSNDGDYMMVEVKNGDERVLLPEQLKKLLIKEYKNIVLSFHEFDNANGTMYKACRKILNKIDKHIA